MAAAAAGGDPCLVVFARAPVVGLVKSRLWQPRDGAAAALTAEHAAAVYAAFIADVCAGGARSGIPRRRLYVAGDVTHPHLVRVAQEHGFAIRAQQGADLGDRMAAAINAELAAGARSVVLIGTDSPTLPASYLRRAAAFLSESTEVVLGPAADGGYYLIGARVPIPTIFAAGMAWGTAQVLPETLRRLRQLADHGTRVALLPFFYDVDTPYDLRLLASHLRLADELPRPLAGEGRGEGSRDGTAPSPSLSRERARGQAASDLLADIQAPASYAVLKELGWL